jgi:hypothetical protein
MPALQEKRFTHPCTSQKGLGSIQRILNHGTFLHHHPSRDRNKEHHIPCRRGRPSFPGKVKRKTNTEWMSGPKECGGYSLYCIHKGGHWEETDENTGRTIPRTSTGSAGRGAGICPIPPGKTGKGQKKYLSQTWAGGLKEFRNQYTSLELQKKALEWRGD